VIICAFCEFEAKGTVDGVPTCEDCSGKPEIGSAKLQDGEIRAALGREILASTARAHAASEALIAIMGDIPSGLPHPDGSQRIQNAAHALAAARNEVMRAHAKLNEFLTYGVLSGDLEPGGPA
jgi:hypothetical protein